MTIVSPARAGTDAAPDDAELLRRHRPYLLYDSQEDYRAAAAETIAANPGNRLVRGKEVLAGVNGEGGRTLALALLHEGEERDQLTEAPWPVLAARRMQADPRYANRVYGRVVRGERIWLQYWMWLYYNPKNLLGMGRHEGDWEMVQVALDPDTLAPVAATYAQHGKGEAQDDMGRVEWHRCDPGCAGPCRHPVVYVAPFSHASYFERGTHVYLPGIDNPDGAEPVEELPDVEPFGAWRSWPGRWGSREAIIGQGPPSPERQDSWNAEAFHAGAKRRRPLHERRLWKLGNRTFPEPPLIERAERRGDTVVVGYRLRRTFWKRPRWLLVSVHDRGRSIRKRILRVRGREGETRIPLRDGYSDRLTVTASTFNLLRQRSDRAGPREVVAGVAPELRDDWGPRVWKAFHRALLNELSRNGASSLDDLMRRRFHVLELPLDRQELVAVVDSARRAGLIAPLGQAEDAEGNAIGSVEWAPTDTGRSRLQSFGRFLSRISAAIPSAVLAAVVTGTLWPWLKNQNVVVAVLCAAALLAFLWIAYQYLQGAGAPAIAARWSRHAVELPVLNRWQCRLAPAAVPVIVLALAGGMFALLTVSLWFLVLFVPAIAVLGLGTRELGLILFEARAAREQGLA
jgi:hypothetical protein